MFFKKSLQIRNGAKVGKNKLLSLTRGEFFGAFRPLFVVGKRVVQNLCLHRKFPFCLFPDGKSVFLFSKAVTEDGGHGSCQDVIALRRKMYAV